MQFVANGSFSDNLSNKQTTVSLNPELTFWNALDNHRALVLKSSASAQLRVGQDIPFYQSARLGGAHNLRSYRFQRFTGQQAATGSVDLEYSLKPIKTKFLPIRSLVYIGSDVGRVWATDEDSKKWHNSYGGGLLVQSVGLETGISYFYGNEGGRLAFYPSFGL